MRDDSSNVWWSCDESDYDEHGRLVEFGYGNGLVSTYEFNPLTGRMEGMEILQGALGVADYGFGYDRVGNLGERSLSRGLDTLTETCTYDGLNRLLSASTSGSPGYSISATYDDLGNIATRSDIGSYLYGSGRPHAVSSAGDCTYYYDANGNVVRRDRNSQYEFTAQWNSFNKPVSIFADLEGSEFEYDVNGKRTQQLIFEDGEVRKKIYVAETYEMEERLLNPTETDRSLWQWSPVHSRIYVDTPAGRIGVYEQAALLNGAGPVVRSWLHKDHLGSVVAVSDSSATITHYSFDAWGNRRDASDWFPILPSEIGNHQSAMTDRGYTGHEQLDHLQLIHMNGRIYDPVIGRMISPDPIIQAPENLQSFNRYSYVMNRPLSLNDPSGFVSAGLERVLGSVWSGGAAGGSSGPKKEGGCGAQPISNGSLAVKDAVAAVADLVGEKSSGSWGFSSNDGSNGSDGWHDVPDPASKTEATEYRPGSGDLMPDLPDFKTPSGAIKRKGSGGGYGLGTGGGRRRIGTNPSTTGLNANDVELGKGDGIKVNLSAGGFKKTRYCQMLWMEI